MITFKLGEKTITIVDGKPYEVVLVPLESEGTEDATPMPRGGAKPAQQTRRTKGNHDPIAIERDLRAGMKPGDVIEKHGVQPYVVYGINSKLKKTIIDEPEPQPQKEEPELPDTPERPEPSPVPNEPARKKTWEVECPNGCARPFRTGVHPRLLKCPDCGRRGMTILDEAAEESEDEPNNEELPDDMPDTFEETEI